MNKNLLKIGALALGMFAFGLTVINTNAQSVTGDVSLTINSGVSECLYGTSLNLWAQAVKFNAAYEFSGNFTEDFSCVDYRGNKFGATGGWTFDIIVDDLSNGSGSSIASGNVSINHTDGIIVGDTSCEAGFSTGATRTPINETYQIIERTAGTDGVCSVTIDTLSLKVNVNPNQAPGAYVGVLTLTVPNF